MKLLPDFSFEGHMFSLQYPYTIDGFLIVDINLSFESGSYILQLYYFNKFLDPVERLRCFSIDIIEFIIIIDRIFQEEIKQNVDEYIDHYGNKINAMFPSFENQDMQDMNNHIWIRGIEHQVLFLKQQVGSLSIGYSLPNFYNGEQTEYWLNYIFLIRELVLQDRFDSYDILKLSLKELEIHTNNLLMRRNYNYYWLSFIKCISHYTAYTGFNSIHISPSYDLIAKILKQNFSAALVSSFTIKWMRSLTDANVCSNEFLVIPLSGENIVFSDPNFGTISNFRVESISLEHDSPHPYWKPSEKNYIHPHNYTPTYIKHFLSSNEKLFLGVEIEVDNNTVPNEKQIRNEVVKKCIQIINGSDSDKEDLIYSTADSTMQIELDTMPCSLSFHKQMRYKELFEFLDKQGYKGHDGKNAGLHVHVNRDYLGFTSFHQQLAIMKIIYILEKFNNEICILARKDNDYSKFCSLDKDTPIEKFIKYEQCGKKVALNLQHKDTIEFRCFKSTLKYDTFILILEFIQYIVDYAKQVDITEIENITWETMLNQMPKNIKQYYNERFEKIKRKAIKTIKKQNLVKGRNPLKILNNARSTNQKIQEIKNIRLNELNKMLNMDCVLKEEC